MTRVCPKHCVIACPLSGHIDTTVPDGFNLKWFPLKILSQLWSFYFYNCNWIGLWSKRFDVASCGHLRGPGVHSSLKIIRCFVTCVTCCTSRPTVCVPDCSAAGDWEWNLSDLWGWLRQKMKREWKRCTGTELARVHQWPLAELSYPQLAPAEMGEGGGALTKTAATLKRGREWKRARSHRQGEIETEGRGGKREGGRSEQKRLGVQVYQNMT